MSQFSKENVLRTIQQQSAPPPQGLLGNMRDPVNMRARQEYNRYAIERQQQGLPAAPFEEWMKQYMTQPQQPNMMQRLRGLLGM